MMSTKRLTVMLTGLLCWGLLSVAHAQEEGGPQAELTRDGSYSLSEFTVAMGEEFPAVRDYAKYAVYRVHGTCEKEVLGRKKADENYFNVILHANRFRTEEDPERAEHRYVIFAAWHAIKKFYPEGSTCTFELIDHHNNDTAIPLPWNSTTYSPELDVAIQKMPKEFEPSWLEETGGSSLLIQPVNYHMPSPETSEVFAVCRNTYGGWVQTRVSVHELTGPTTLHDPHEHLKPGCSGSPVFTTDGNLMGIIYAVNPITKQVIFTPTWEINFKLDYWPNIINQINFADLFYSEGTSYHWSISEKGLNGNFNPQNAARYSDYPDHVRLQDFVDKWIPWRDRSVWHNFPFEYELAQQNEVLNQAIANYHVALGSELQLTTVNIKGAEFEIPFYPFYFQGNSHIDQSIEYVYLIDEFDFNYKAGQSAERLGVDFDFWVFKKIVDIDGEGVRYQKVFNGQAELHGWSKDRVSVYLGKKDYHGAYTYLNKFIGYTNKAKSSLKQSSD